MFTFMRATIPRIIAQVAHTNDTRSGDESLQIYFRMQSKDDERRTFMILIFIFREEFILWKSAFTPLEELSHRIHIIGHDAEGYRKSAHHEKLQYPSHVAIVVYYIREDIYAFYFHVVILRSFYKMQQYLLFITKK